MSKRDSPEASSQYIQGDEIPGDEIPGDEVQYLQYTIHSASSREDRKHNTVNEISVIKTVGTWTKTPDSFQETVGSSFQSGQEPSSLKKKRNFFTCFQKLELENIFFHNPYPSKEMSEYLALRFGSTPHSMKIWFKNRRARQRKSSSSQPCYQQQPPLQYQHQDFHQLYYPSTVRKEPFCQPEQINTPSGPKVIIDPPIHRRSAFSLYIKTEDSRAQE